MATTSIWSIKNRLDHVLDYVGNSKKTSYENDDLLNVLHYAEDDFKTEEKKLVSGINCDVKTAHKKMTITKKRFNKLGGVILLHGYQSFNEGEVTPTLAHEIGVKLANEMWGDRFEVIVATHINTKHIHNHIVVNSVSFVDGMKAYNNRAEYSRMRYISDEICKEYGLSVLEEKPCGKYNIDYSKVYESDVVHSNQKTKAKAVIDYAISKAKKYSDFIGILNELGYFVTQRTKNSLSIRDVAHYNRNIRVIRALGEDYTIERIKERIYSKNKVSELDKLLNFNKVYCKRIYMGAPIDKVKLKLSPLYRKYIKYMFAIKQYSRNFYYQEMTPQIYRTLTTESLAVFMPFRVQEVQHDKGVYYGQNVISKNMIIADRRELLNGNSFILGVSGSGKSFIGKEELTSIRLGNKKADIIIIDPEREDTELVRELGGEVIDISATSRNHINALDINKDYGDGDNPVILKSQFIMSLCEQLIVSRKLGENERSIIDRCTAIVYNEFKKNDYRGGMPTLVDFRDVLLAQPEREAKDIALALELFTNGSLNTFAKETNVVRKYGAFATGITQNVEDLLQSHQARTMLSNSEFIIMLNQAATDRQELAKLLNISDTQIAFITNVGAGEGLVKIGSNIIPFENKFPQDTNLYKLMTTKPKDREFNYEESN